jgi:hypothetical protein
MCELAQSFLGVRDLTTVKLENRRGTRVIVGMADLAPLSGGQDLSIPILIHGFTNSPSGPQRKEDFKAIALAFRERVDSRLFAFT